MTELTSPPQKTNTDFLSQPLIASLNLDWEKAIYIAFIILALVTRFYGLGDRVMSHDESLHTQFSYQFFRGDGFNHTPLMHGPFLFHITPLAYWLFGDNDFSARVPVALFGVVLVLLPYFLRSWLGRIGAIFTSFIFLISPFLLYYSRYIRHDIYIITFAIILFIAIWHYLDKRREKYLYWFAVGLALMFATKEVAFIYVAIFGSFLVIRLLPQLITADWFPKIRAKFTLPLIIIILGLLLLAGGLIGQRVLIQSPEEVAATETTEPFAADPETDATVETEPPASPTETMMRWLQIAGLGVFSLGLFLAANAMRPHLDEYPEFDLIMLFATLLLPMVSPLLVVMAGWNPQEYTFNNCLLNGQETMSGFQLAIARLTTGSWWSCIAGSALMKTGAFLIGTIVIAALVGLWWNRRRWLVAAAVFYAIFLLLYTSFFTNMTGFTSGMVGSLGYWLEQQEVQRGSQPVFYYFFVVPFYEFLPLLFSLLAIRLWTMKYRLSKILGYWLLVFVLAWAGYSLGNWWFNITAVTIGEESAKFPGLLIASLILMAGLLYWFLIRAGQIKRGYELDSSLFRLFQWPLLIDFVPFVTWWLLLTWVAYSYAGEKMPWLSTHFVIPMGILSGWYFNQKLQYFDFRTLFSKNSLMYLGLTIVTVIALFLAIGPVILGVVQLGIQDIDNLSSFGRVIGSLIVVGILFYLWQLVRERIVDGRLRSALWSLSIFGILSLLTIRFAYMASFPNADYAREFLVYAHGAPAAKS
ncbi:MAG: TIGR03663 family protein, partial [Chloroflexi bacterium]|nr:TIGR03663 family protein [Chloroflexota bacterium]